jgi:ABC-type antimicrobial peptide transport system permease subunit
MLVRVRGGHQPALASVRAAVRGFDKDLAPSLELLNFEDFLVSVERAMTRIPALFAAGLAILSLALASLGIYGVMAYLVSQRTREIGVRMALGASARTLLREIILQGLRPVSSGLTLGLCCAAALSFVAHAPLTLPGSFDLLYGVPFYDPVTFIGISIFVALIAAIASAVPARRALRVDPMVALRYE